jgi:hypothetical protein
MSVATSIRQKFDKLWSETKMKKNPESEFQYSKFVKLWKAFTKMLRINLEHGKIIDSLYFGQFYRKSSDNDADAKPQYMWSQNLKNDKQLDKPVESNLLNLNAICQICKCTVDFVHSFLNKIIDIIHDNCKNKVKTTHLDMGVGTLTFHPNMTVEFKNSGSDSTTNGKGKLETLKIQADLAKLNKMNIVGKQARRGSNYARAAL